MSEQETPRWATWDDGGDHPRCDRCAAFARWSVCNLEGPWLDPIVRWFACGRHLSQVVADAPWEVDSVHLYDLTGAHS